MDKWISRRRFVAAASASAASVMIVPRHVLGGAGLQAPSDTLNIGVGGRGRADARGCGSENIAALCDADLGFAARTFREFPDARVYADYRRYSTASPTSTPWSSRPRTTRTPSSRRRRCGAASTSIARSR